MANKDYKQRHFDFLDARTKRQENTAKIARLREEERKKNDNVNKNVFNRRLIDFGMELFTLGYDFDEFVTDVVACFMYDSDNKRETYNKIFDKYKGFSYFPSYIQMIKLITNNNLLNMVENGYNYAKKNADSDSMIQNSKRNIR